MKRKILLLFLIAALITAAGGTYSGYAENEYDTSERMAAIRLFEQIAVVPHYIDSSIFDKSVTRADYALYIARMFKVDEYDEGISTYFSDIPTGHFAYSAVNILCKMRIVKQGDGYFEPDSALKYEEAVAMYVRMLGYGDIAEADGGYPSGYIKIARRLNFTAGIPSSDEISLGNALTMAKNVMLAPVYEASAYGSDQTYYKESDTTLFELYWDLKCEKGIVEGIWGSSLYEMADMEENECCINGVTYDATEFDIDAMLGLCVETIYRQEHPDGEKHLVYVIPVDNRVLELNCEDIVSVEGTRTLQYFQDSKTKKLSIDANAAIIQNGSRLNANIEKNLKPGIGTVKFIDNDGDNRYDVAIYRIPKLVKVAYKDNDTHTLYNDYGGESIDCGKIDYLRSEYRLLSTGEIVFFDNIDPGSVLNIYISEKCLEVVICDTTISGVVERRSISGDRITVTVNGMEYRVNPQFADSVGTDANVFSIGHSGVFVLDDYGMLAAESSSLNEGVHIGFVSKMADGSSVFAKSKLFKIMDQSGSMLTTETADKWKVNDVSIKNGDISATPLVTEKGELIPQLICYTLDKGGKLISVATAEAESDDNQKGDLILTNEYGDRSYAAGAKMFGQRIVIGANTICFIIPKDEDIKNTQDEDFGVVKTTFFSDWQTYNIATFKTNPEAPVEEVLVCRQTFAEKAGNKSDTILVDEIGFCVNDEGTMVEYLKCLSMGVSTQFLAEESFRFSDCQLQRGDVIRVGKTSKGYVAEVQILYRYGDDSFESVVPSPNFNSDNQYWMGLVHSNLNGVIKFGTNSWAVYDTVGDVRSVPVMIYNPNLRENQVYIGSYEDIKGYRQSGSSGDRIIIRTNHGVVKAAIVYRQEES